MSSLRTVQQCIANTGKNQRCKKKTAKSPYCFIHLNKVEHLQIKKSTIPDAGLGLFATDPGFKKDKRVVEYTGKVYSKPVKGPYVLEVNKHKYIDARRTSSSAARFANDQMVTAKNNSKFAIDRKNNTVSLKAVKKIKPGAEITVSYGKDYWKRIKKPK
jgi:hypothetical protein